MNKHLVLAFAVFCCTATAVNAKPSPTYPGATYPTYPEVSAPTYPETTYPESTYPGTTYPEATYPQTEKQASASIDNAVKAQLDAKRLVNVTVEDPTEEVKASCKGVVLNPKGDILLDSKCGNLVAYTMQAAIGAPEKTQQNTFVSILVDMTPMRKDWKSTEPKAGAKRFTQERDEVIYHMRVNPDWAASFADIPVLTPTQGKRKLPRK